MNFFSSAALIGMGKSNTALARFLSEQGVKLSLRDKSTNAPIPADLLDNPLISVNLGSAYLSGLYEDVIFRSPSVRPDLPEISEAVSRGATLSSETEYFFSLCPSPIIAITGSDGKTTTATLCREILSKKYGDGAYLLGNVGTPAVSTLASIRHTDICITELSSFQLMDFCPVCNAALITNITENHLNWHTDINEYIHAKTNIYKNASLCVINADDPICSEIHIAGSIYYSISQSREKLAHKYGRARFVFIDNDDVFITEHGTGKRKYLFSLSDIRIPGRHNAANAVAAAALCADYVSSDDIKSAISAFEGVDHRCSFIGEYGGIRYIESSIDSTPSRTAATVKAVGKVKGLTVICGGANKNLSYTPLCDVLSEYAETVIFTGACGMDMMNSIISYPTYNPLKTNISYVQSFDEAVKTAINKTVKGGCVLLSPAATSFDCFSNYVERAERFRNIIFSLSDNNAHNEGSANDNSV